MHPERSAISALDPVAKGVARSSAPPPAEPELGVPAQFLADLAAYTDGVGWVQTLECLKRRGVLAELGRVGAQGIRFGDLVAASSANPGYLAVFLRVLSAQGFAWREIERDADETRIGLRATGRELFHLLQSNDASAAVCGFLPMLSHMSAYLTNTESPARNAPSLADLVRRSERGWGLPDGLGERERAVTRRLRAALDGNLVGPVMVALRETVGLGREGEPREFAPRGERMRAAFELLAHAGWVEWIGSAAHLTERGAYAARRALAFGVPVSYLPLFGRIDTLLFGDAESFWQRQASEPEQHVQRSLNVRASGASHQRYFAAVDEVLKRAFNRPLSEQPRGFCDMGSGDGAWLEHVWHLIQNHTERGRLMREFPRDDRYQLVLVGADYNEAARSATRERLTRAGIPHLVVKGDINAPAQLRADLGSHGIDSRELLHGNSFLVHNRPFTGVKDGAAAERRRGVGAGAYAWRGRVVPNAVLEQNLVEFFRAWREVIGEHGLIAIELHDPECVAVGKTLTNYMLTHGLSDQFTIGIGGFLAAAAEAGLAINVAEHRVFPEPRAVATISVSHFQLASPVSAR